MKITVAPAFLSGLKRHLENQPHLIKVILGPRQVGKTTGILQFLKNFNGESLYVSSDDEVSPTSNWLLEQWQKAVLQSPKCLLAIDEIQKVPQWSTVIKSLWEQQKKNKKTEIKLILLGSSSLQIQKGLNESLTGRFELIQAHHWNLKESRELRKFDLNDFVQYGGYPGSYSLIPHQRDWENYIKHSVIETVIGKDILNLARVTKPALFRQAFSVLMSYPAQEISYTKLLGQLQDSGNTDLVKYYIELYEGAFLIKPIHKYSPKVLVTRSSSPKLIPMCGALISRSVFKDKVGYGRAFEASVGAALSQAEFDLHYWRDGNAEVDYVFESDRDLFAIEVKSGAPKSSKGLTEFTKRFKNAKPIFISESNAESFLLNPKIFVEKLK